MPTQAKQYLKERRLDDLHTRCIDYQNKNVVNIFTFSTRAQTDLGEFETIYKSVHKVLNFNKVKLVKVENYGCYIDFFNKTIMTHYFPVTWQEAYLLAMEIAYLLVGYHGILATQQLFYLIVKENFSWDETLLKQTLSYVEPHFSKNLN